MLAGLIFTFAYILYFKFVAPQVNSSEHWLLGISPEGIGALGMLINITVTLAVSQYTPAPPKQVQQMVDDMRIPAGAGTPSAHSLLKKHGQ